MSSKCSSVESCETDSSESSTASVLDIIATIIGHSWVLVRTVSIGLTISSLG